MEEQFSTEGADKDCIHDFVGVNLKKRSLGRSRRTWNEKCPGLKWGGYWVDPTQDRVRWRTLLLMVLGFRILLPEV